MNSTGKIAKGLLCAFLFVLLSLSLLTGVCAAETQNITFVSDGVNRTITIDYNEVEYFSSNASEYNLGLAQASLAMAAAAFAPESEHYAGTDEAAKEYRCQYLKSAYKKLGFNESEMSFYNYDKPLNSTDDKVAYGIANKTISVGGGNWTLFAVQVRGGGYAGEWASNLHIDPYEIRGTNYSIGFGKPAKEIYDKLKESLDLIPEDNGTKKVKIWISGFSRGAAVSNALAGELTKHAAKLGLEKENIYAYTFATPNAVLINPEGDVETNYKNIHNTLNPCDIVPVVPMSVSSFGWNYSKYGTTHYYNYGGFTEDERDQISKMYEKIVGDDSYEPISDSGTIPVVFELCLGKTITPEKYNSGFYPYVGEMISLAFCGDKADMARLLALNTKLDLLHPNDANLKAAKEETKKYFEENEDLKDEVSFYLITRVVEIIQLFLDNANNANSNNNGPLQELVDGTVTIGFYKKIFSWDDSKMFLNTVGKLADTLIAAISALKDSDYDIKNVLTIITEHHPEVYMSVLFSGIDEKNLFMSSDPLDLDKLHVIIYETKGGVMEKGEYIEVYDITKSPDYVSTKKPTKDGYTFKGWVNENNEDVTYVDISEPGYTHLTAVWTAIPQPSHSSSRDYGSSIWLTATPTPAPTPTPAAEPTLVQPSAQPIPTKQPATPVPFAGIIAGLSAAAVLFGLRRR